MVYAGLELQATIVSFGAAHRLALVMHTRTHSPSGGHIMWSRSFLTVGHAHANTLSKRRLYHVEPLTARHWSCKHEQTFLAAVISCGTAHRSALVMHTRTRTLGSGYITWSRSLLSVGHAHRNALSKRQLYHVASLSAQPYSGTYEHTPQAAAKRGGW